jgi:leucyl aminopeptidase
MTTFKIVFLFNEKILDDKSHLFINDKIYLLQINIYNISMYNLDKEINKINDLMNFNNKINMIKIIFDKKINNQLINIIVSKLNNILYSYTKMIKNKLFSFSLETEKITDINTESNNLMNELILYKNIVMDPNKNPETYLEYITTRVPVNYDIIINNLNNFDKFPLTKAVGSGSKYNTYFVHIKPKIEDKTLKTIYLIGKSITYDSGGLNIKSSHMEEMKTDMAGSALLLSVLNLLAINKVDSNNIHLLIPIAENMIGNTATRPGQVVKSYNSKMVEITDIDAEGRLCMADCLEYINKDLLNDKNPDNCLIIDVATLTGNARLITAGIASVSTCNQKAENYKNKLIKKSEETGEYLEFIKLRPEYLDFLKSPVADIKNLNLDIKGGGCIVAGSFLHYFAGDNIPWIHLDIAPSAFSKEKSKSYGVNLLYEFIKEIL